MGWNGGRRQPWRRWSTHPLHSGGNGWWRRRVQQLEVKLESKLKKELFGLLVPVCPEFLGVFVHFSAWYLEGNGFIWLCSKQEILPATVGRLNPLLICCHETIARVDVVHNFRVVNLKK